MTIRIDDTDARLADNPNATAVPSDRFPRHDPKVEDPRDLPELRWRGTQEWICSFVAAWAEAESWYVIDWGDGTADVCHPKLRIARHSYTKYSSCSNIQNTAVARPLYRDGTTGPAVARSVLQARGWGAPQHDLSVYPSAPRKMIAELFRTEKPLGYGIAWDPDTAIQHLDDDKSSASHDYPAGPARRPLIGILDRPARRLRWFTGGEINKTKKAPDSALTAWFGDIDEWDGGYSGKLHVTNHTANELLWQVEFDVDSPGVLREVWPMPTTQMKQLTENRWRVWSTKPLAAGAEVTVGMRVEPPGAPTKWPQNIQASKQREGDR